MNRVIRQWMTSPKISFVELLGVCAFANAMELELYGYAVAVIAVTMIAQWALED